MPILCIPDVSVGSPEAGTLFGIVENARFVTSARAYRTWHVCGSGKQLLRAVFLSPRVVIPVGGCVFLLLIFVVLSCGGAIACPSGNGPRCDNARLPSRLDSKKVSDTDQTQLAGGDSPSCVSVIKEDLLESDDDDDNAADDQQEDNDAEVQLIHTTYRPKNRCRICTPSCTRIHSSHRTTNHLREYEHNHSETIRYSFEFSSSPFARLCSQPPTLNFAGIGFLPMKTSGSTIGGRTCGSVSIRFLKDTILQPSFSSQPSLKIMKMKTPSMNHQGGARHSVRAVPLLAFCLLAQGVGRSRRLATGGHRRHRWLITGP